jgi:hypothetical protein
MTLAIKQQQTVRWLIIYMISALLFVTSSDLHIHSREAAATSEHGAAVSISKFSDELSTLVDEEEIKVSPDGVIKVNSQSVNLFAVFMLILLIAVVVFRQCSSGLICREVKLPQIPFHGTPPLRAPPQ